MANNSKVSSRVRSISPSSEGLKRDLIGGAEFGEAVVGEGLGRIGTDPTIAGIESRLKELSKGFSGKEFQARKDVALEQIGQRTQAEQRALQAALARAGVKGGAAGAQLRDVAVGGLQARAGLERDLLLQQRQAEREGIQDLAQFATGTRQFDISQAAREKNIALQSGLGFAQLGAAERGAQFQRDAADRAAQAALANAQQKGPLEGIVGGFFGGGGSSKSNTIRTLAAPMVNPVSTVKKIFCNIAGTRVLMEDKTYKNIEDIKVGDVVHMGGKVYCAGQAFAGEDLYEYNGEIATGSHLIWKNGAFIKISSLGTKTDLDHDTIVYPIATEGGFYFTSQSNINGDVMSEEYTGIGIAK